MQNLRFMGRGISIEILGISIEIPEISKEICFKSTFIIKCALKAHLL